MITDPSHLERLLDRQSKLWEMRRTLARQGGEAARSMMAHLAEGPWLAVSKQIGSGGTEIARTAGERLGWQVYDREILLAIGRETHMRQKVLSRLDGHATGILEDFLSQLLVPGDPGQLAFVQEMVRVIYAIGRQGQAVLVGRGANWILGPQFGLRVRVIAPAEHRAAAVAKAENIDLTGARRRVKQDDAEQSRLIRKIFRKEVDDPTGYDLILNTGAMDLVAAAETILTALRRKLGA